MHPWNAWIISKPVAPTVAPVCALFGLSQPAGKSQWELTASSGVLGPHKAMKQIRKDHRTFQSREFLPLFHGAEHTSESTTHPASLARLYFSEARQGEWKEACCSGRETQNIFPPPLLPWKLYSPREGKKNIKLQQRAVLEITAM